MTLGEPVRRACKFGSQYWVQRALTKLNKLSQLPWLAVLVAAYLVCAAAPAWAAEQTGQAETMGGVLLGVAVILLGAKLAAHWLARIQQPAVLGELLFGLVLGNLTLAGFHGLDYLRTDPSIEMLAQLGVVILLFRVGLESTVREMMQVGVSALLVATFGVIGTFVLGWTLGTWLLPQDGVFSHLFLGAILSATSVGITARVLRDLGKSQSREARIILGAAVIDDVEGLLILAVIMGAVAAANTGEGISYGGIAWIVLKATVFLGGSLAIGVRLAKVLFHLAARLKTRGVLLAAGLVFCFFWAWLAEAIGLAPIVGAFSAGLILENLHYQDFTQRGEPGLEELVEPIESFLAPIFFVLMGVRTDLRSFAAPGVIGLAVALTLAAILGKQLCGLGVIGSGIDRLSVGLGMIPRGEVGLIIASFGLTLRVGGEPLIDQSIFSAVVIVVIVTTLVTPTALKWSLTRSAETKRRGGHKRGAEGRKT